MADLTKTVKVLFQGQDSITPSLKTMSRNMESFGSGLSKVADPFVGIATSVLALDAAIAALAVGGVAFAVGKFAAFEDVMLKVKGVLGASDAEYAALTETTKNLGATTKFTAMEAAQGLEFLALAGMNTTTAMEALPNVLNLAQASAMDLGAAADLVTNIMAGYGIKSKDLAKTNDVLTATFTNSNTSLAQLGEAFKFVGPVAKSLGFSLEETAATLGVLGNAGYQAEKGGTSLRNIMLALVAPAGNMGKLMKELGVDTNELGVDFSSSANALKSLGVNIKDSSGNILPFANILDQIKAGLEAIPDPADRTATLVEIFGKRGGPQLAALLEQGSGAITGLEKKIDSLGGITKKIADQMESGMGGSLRAISSAFEAITLEIGEKAAKAIKPGAMGVIDLFRAIQSEVKTDSFKPLFDALAAFGADIEAELKQITANLPEALKGLNFDDLIASFKDLSNELGGLFGAIDLSTPEGLRNAIQLVIDSIAGLSNVTAGLIDMLSPMSNDLTLLVKTFNALPDGVQKFAGQILGLSIAMAGLGAILVTGSAVMSGLSALAGLFAAGGALSVGLTALGAVITGPVGIAVGLTALTVAGLSTMNSLTGVAEAAETVKTKLYAIPERKAIEFSVESNDSDWAAITTEIDSVVQKVEKVAQELSWFDEDGKEHKISIPVESSGIEDAKKKIEEIPTEKKLEIKLQGEIDKDIARITSSADVAKSAFEWTAKLNIAEAEADAQKITAVFNGAASSVAALSGSTSDMFGSLLSNYSGLSRGDQTAFTRQVEKEQDSRNEALKSQTKLNDAQAEFMKEKTKAMRNGKALIEIDSTGLEPALEKVMWEILKKVQIRATEESADFLLGIDA